MPSPEELRLKFTAFPTVQHVQSVCRAGQGAEQCRYLSQHVSLTGTQNYCSRGSEYERERRDEQVARGDIKARGDNCPGTLGFVIDNQELLMGNRTVHHEAGKDYEGTFTGVHQRNGIIEVAGIGTTARSVDVNISQEGIVFSARYIGFATIFFEKPQETGK
ncbi:hypothetical protein M1437_03645 [Patescibacteria group bacterium]|nr:hypothetical protein [Patescibacteria group bacterium]